MARQENDFYPTPWPLPLRMCERIAKLYPSGFDYIVEPSVGTGPFIKACREVFPSAPSIGVDIVDVGRDACIQAGASAFVKSDWVQWIQSEGTLPRTLIVGNPPFSLATEHILAALNSSAPGTVIAMLLRVSFLSGQYRCDPTDPLNIYPRGEHRYLVPIVGRPVFVTTEKAQNDNNEYGMFIWETGYQGDCTITKDRLFWKEKRFKKQKEAA